MLKAPKLVSSPARSEILHSLRLLAPEIAVQRRRDPDRRDMHAHGVRVFRQLGDDAGDVRAAAEKRDEDREGSHASPCASSRPSVRKASPASQVFEPESPMLLEHITALPYASI